jgi:hypothetical protein
LSGSAFRPATGSGLYGQTGFEAPDKDVHQ